MLHHNQQTGNVFHLSQNDRLSSPTPQNIVSSGLTNSPRVGVVQQVFVSANSHGQQRQQNQQNSSFFQANYAQRQAAPSPDLIVSGWGTSDEQYHAFAKSLSQQQQQPQQHRPMRQSAQFPRHVPNDLQPSRKSQFDYSGYRIATRPVVSSSNRAICNVRQDETASQNCSALYEASNLKTPVSLVEALAKKNNISALYETMSMADSSSVPQPKPFTVVLKLGVKETHIGTGNSLIEAKQNAAQHALRLSSYVTSLGTARPAHKERQKKAVATKKDSGVPIIVPDNREASMTPTVELNALAMKYRLKVAYEDNQVRRPSNEGGKIQLKSSYVTTCKIGSFQFSSEGPTRKESRQNAAKEALKKLTTLEPDVLSTLSTGTPPNLQSEVSQVYDFAAKHGLVVKFDIETATALPDQIFVSWVSLSNDNATEAPHNMELRSMGQGKSKKEAKQQACLALLTQIRQKISDANRLNEQGEHQTNQDEKFWILLNSRPSTTASQVVATKKTLPDVDDPDYGIALNPISRLFQIFQAKKNGTIPVFTDITNEHGEREENEKETNEDANQEDKKDACDNVGPDMDSKSISVKTTEDGKYVFLLSDSTKIVNPKPRSKQSACSHFFRCTVGDKVVVTEAASQKVAKASSAVEMLKVLGYNVVEPPAVTSPPIIASPPYQENEKKEDDEVKPVNKRKSKAKNKPNDKKPLQKKPFDVHRAQPFFHPALYAPPKSESLNPSHLLSAHDLLTKRAKATLSDVVITAKKFIGFKEKANVEDLIKISSQVCFFLK